MAKSREEITRQLRDLWADLNDLIRDCGGWTVSRPDVWPLRFEVQAGSEWPWQLRYEVTATGTAERLLPTANQNPAPQQVAVFELKRPR